MKNPLLQTLVSLRGNPRACVYTEPMWGLSMNLCLPYASVYMLTLGLSDTRVGFIATVFMACQVLFAFLSGPLTDKMGRRMATAVFDFLGWSIPCVIWWMAGSKDAKTAFLYFFVAALFNGMSRVPVNSWDCLLVEDAEKSQITRIYSLVVMSGQLSALFAPISSILVSKLTLVPAIRILYVNAFIVMTLKICVLFLASRETGQGKVRMAETKGKSLLSLAAGYGGVLKIIGTSRGTVFSLVITALVGAVGMINTTFWQVIVSRKLLVPDPLLPLFPMLRSFIAMFFLMFVTPHLARKTLRTPLLLGFAAYFTGQTLLVLAPAEGMYRYGILAVSLTFDGFGASALTMLAESLVALHVNAAERARVMALQHMIIMAATAPFGWIGGLLSQMNRNLPFVLTMCILLSGIAVTLIYYAKNPEAQHVGSYEV